MVNAHYSCKVKRRDIIKYWTSNFANAHHVRLLVGLLEVGPSVNRSVIILHFHAHIGLGVVIS